MSEKEFCLLHEHWILVMRKDGKTEEVSLLDLYRHAQDYQRLAGELPTQDVAVLRLLLAILHAIFARYDLNGNSDSISSPGDALERWKALWDRGSFPMGIIEDYLTHFEDRFYLFHPKYPFYQVAGLDKATEYTAAKLNGELSESNNKLRLFPQRAGNDKNVLTYSEAARWLLYVNAFDDTSSKSKRDKFKNEDKIPSPGAGWLGKLGLIYAVGNNLFETLLLNLVFLRDGENKLPGQESPVWERNDVKATERTEITIPDNPSELLTLQSRRLLLKRERDKVIGYLLLGGDFFQRENAFSEQMTVWRNAAKKETDPPEYLPRRHDPSRQLWRDFSVLVGQGENKHRPGVISWVARLKTDHLVTYPYICFQIAAVKYGDKDFFVDDIFSDSLTFNSDLLTKLGEYWTSRIIDEVQTTDKLVDQVGWLAQNLARATGNTDGYNQRNIAKEQTYFRLDMPFRHWLEGIDPNRDSMDKACNRWWEEEKRIVRSIGRELVNQCGPQAFVGRSVKDERKNQEYLYTAPEVYNRFLYRTSSREALRKGEKENGQRSKASK